MSTVIELGGFGLITYAAYGFNHLLGYLVGGLFLVVIGYATNDHAIAARTINPIAAWIEAKRKKAG